MTMPQTGPTMGDLAYTPEDIQRVRGAFQQYLGRDAGDDASVVNDHLQGDVYRTGGIDAVVNAIANSQEANERRQQTSATTAGEPQAGNPFLATPYTDRGSGTGANWNYTGYDFGQDANNRLIGKSAKYTMAEAQRRAQAAGATDSWRTKEGAADFANQYLKKYLEDNGFEVLDIVGDKMKIRDYADRAAGREGSWVDWVVGAGGPNAQLGWQVENTQEAFGAPETYRPQGFAPTSGGPTVGAPTPPAETPPANPNSAGPDMNSDAYRALAAQPGTIQYGVEAIRRAFQQYLGRDAGSYEQIVREHLGNGRAFGANNLAAVIEGIRTSPEAQRYAQRPGAPRPPAPTMSDLAYPPELMP